MVMELILRDIAWYYCLHCVCWQTTAAAFLSSVVILRGIYYSECHHWWI